MTDPIQIFRDWITPIIAVLAFGLSLWSRVDKWREDRKKNRDALPWASLNFSGAEQIESTTHSVRTLVVEFRNSSRHRWIVDQIELLKPTAALLRKRSGDQPWAKKVHLDWTVSAIEEQGDGRSNGFVSMRFERAPVTDGPGPTREVGVGLRIRKAGAKAGHRIIEAWTDHRF